MPRPAPLDVTAVNLPAVNGPAVLPTMRFGTPARPDGATITADAVGLRRDGRPWLATMGEVHYARVPRGEWRDALLKMRAGGIQVIASYAFWIHHEEVEGHWDFTGDRDLRAFVETCRDLDLPLVMRIGPWCHGEVRNGGLPEWLLDEGVPLRGDDARYMRPVRRLYAQYAAQLKGLLWKDGGPVVGIQVENEYHGPAEHLVHLKILASELGLDVPLYTRTGWPRLTTPMPLGELLPLHGGYAEGFWDRSLEPMPGNYWREFCFNRARETSSIATDHFGNRVDDTSDEEGVYPFLTCELGGGMMSSYHRRIKTDPRDAPAVALCKLGSGSNLLGYYMYQGGRNPEGRTPLNEMQATRHTNYNDLPVKTYDFQAALGEFAQVRPHYHLLRRLHLMIADFGGPLVAMPPTFAAAHPTRKADADTLRWAVRSDGRSGFVFVNNYQRGQPMSAKPDTQLTLSLAGDALTLPARPFTVPADASFCWPVYLALAHGVTLAYATAQPLCKLDDGPTRYTFFAQTPGVPSEFAIVDAAGLQIDAATGTRDRRDGRTILTELAAGTGPAVTLRSADGGVNVIVLLDDVAASKLWTGRVGGVDRALLTDAYVLFDGDALRLRTDAPDATLRVAMLPAARSVDGPATRAGANGVFENVDVAFPARAGVRVRAEPVRPPGPPRAIAMGVAKVAAQPTDADFADAGVWRIRFDGDVRPPRRLLLRVHYRGDVARAYAGERLLTDNFYNGTPFDIGLWPFGEALDAGLTIRILPLPAGAPIALPIDAWPPNAERVAVLPASIERVEIIEEREAVVRVT